MPTEAPVSRYSVEIERKSDGVCFGRRRAPDSCLQPAREQLIFEGQRRGLLPRDAQATAVRDAPLFAGSQPGPLAGVRLSIAAAGQEVSREYGIDLFQPFIRQLAESLISGRQLDGDSAVGWRVYVDDVPSAGGEPGQPAAKIRQEPLAMIPGELASFLANAEPVGVLAESDYPVFVLDQALEEARSFVWERNRERGVWLVGNLFWQAMPAEIFCLIHTVFEARGATHERFSLDFSTETFVHAAQQLQLRRQRFGSLEDLLVGFYHTHPFLPSILDGKEACPTCSLRPSCELTTSFFSPRDETFHAAMFGAAPYAVELVLGLTPREEFDLRMFCRDGGSFRERGYYRLATLPAIAKHEEGVR